MYKECFVPSCLNNSQDNVEKLFLSVPRGFERRKKWFALVDYRTQAKKLSHHLYICEDHFDVS